MHGVIRMHTDTTRVKDTVFSVVCSRVNQRTHKRQREARNGVHAEQCLGARTRYARGECDESEAAREPDEDKTGRVVRGERQGVHCNAAQLNLTNKTESRKREEKTSECVREQRQGRP
jgi:hypothetical protein